MKIRLLSLACVALCFACSSPKIAYKFNYHDYNAGRKSKDVQQEVASNPGPVAINSESLVAMETETPAVIAEGKTHEEMTKKERRAFTKEIKKEIKEVQKEYRKEIKKLKKSSDKDNIEEAQAAKAIDRDLKLAAIFGAVGIVALIISGQVFWIIGGIALIIGVVFFVKWLVRQ